MIFYRKQLFVGKLSKGGDNRMKKYGYYLFYTMIISTMLCGCGSKLPELSETEEAVVTEYATNLLVKYSLLADRTLLNDAELETEIAKEEEERERFLKTKEMEKAYLKAMNSDKVTDNTVNTDNTEQNETVSVPQKTVSEFIAEDTISINYASYSLCDFYPDNSVEDFFLAMDATDGHQLCVVKFSVENMSASDQELNMLNKQGRYSLRIDGGKIVQAQSTLLMDDLSSYVGTLPANGKEQLVLIFEVPGDVSQIGTMDLIMEDSSGENILTLQ